MKYKVRICCSPRCKENLSEDLFREARKLISDNPNIEVEKRGCMALCHIGPNVQVVNLETNESKIFNEVQLGGMGEIVDFCK
ncbi:(2Fe-2S) ferredoxin domain-containing protein [Patescibacteria group bacterium]|nr:(2Fe-2S) ferredoxin domain-containing protein [Patescibacteria group bacterium]